MQAITLQPPPLPANRSKPVAAVVVNANGGNHLDRALSSLGRQTLPPRRTIVVDNASTDGSIDLVEHRHPDVEVIRLEENVGFAAANNLAVRAAADCEWIALVNPDAFPEPTWLEELLAAAETNHDYSFFGSRLLRATASGELDGTSDVYHVSGFAWRRDHGRAVTAGDGSSEEIFSPCAAAALYRRDAFLEVGGFDESYFCYFEDTDLSFRLRLAGHRCLYVPTAVARHVGSATKGELSDFTLYHSHRNLVSTYVKNMPSPLAWLYLPQHLLVNVLSVAFFALTGRGRVLLAAKRDVLLDLPRLLGERRRIQRRRQASARELRGVMAGGLVGYRVAAMRARAALTAGSAERRRC